MYTFYGDLVPTSGDAVLGNMSVQQRRDVLVLEWLQDSRIPRFPMPLATWEGVRHKFVTYTMEHPETCFVISVHAEGEVGARMVYAIRHGRTTEHASREAACRSLYGLGPHRHVVIHNMPLV